MSDHSRRFSAVSALNSLFSSDVDAVLSSFLRRVRERHDRRNELVGIPSGGGGALEMEGDRAARAAGAMDLGARVGFIWRRKNSRRLFSTDFPRS